MQIMKAKQMKIRFLELSVSFRIFVVIVILPKASANSVLKIVKTVERIITETVTSWLRHPDGLMGEQFPENSIQMVQTDKR